MNFDFATKILAFILLCIVAVWDMKHHRIPNALVIAFFLLGLVRMFFLKDYASCLIGIVFPSVVLFALRIYKNEIVGFGDIKIVMAVGLFYGYLTSCIIVFIALTMLCIYAPFYKMFGNKSDAICFGPFLALASLLGFVL